MEQHWFVNWHPRKPAELEVVGDEALPDEVVNSPAMSEFIRVINKYPFSKSNKIGAFSFNAQDMTFMMGEIQKCIDAIKASEVDQCTICRQTVNQPVVSLCGCEESQTNAQFYCATCWTSQCFQCKGNLDKTPTVFEPMARILEEIKTYLKDIESSDWQERLTAIARVLRTCELEMMCNYCFGHLEQAMLVRINFASDPTRQSAQCCFGCDHMYMSFYGKYQDSIPLRMFDKVCSEILKLLNNLLAYCNDNNPTGIPPPNPYSHYNETSGHRARAVKYLAKLRSGNPDPPLPIRSLNSFSNDMATFKLPDVYPVKDFQKFIAPPNFPALKDKLKDFNRHLGPLAILGENTVDILIKIGEENKWDEKSEEAVRICLKWPIENVFPILDLLRLAVLNSSVAKAVDHSLNICTELAHTFISPRSATNQMLVVRLLCNIFGTLTPSLMEHRADIQASLLKHPKSDKQSQIAGATLFLNYSIVVTDAENEEWCNEESQTDLLICALSLVEQLKDPEAIYRWLVGIGNLVHKREVIGNLFKSLEGGPILKNFATNISPKINMIVVQLLNALGCNDLRVTIDMK